MAEKNATVHHALPRAFSNARGDEFRASGKMRAVILTDRLPNNDRALGVTKIAHDLAEKMA